MDAVTLLAEAQAAGLTLEVVSDDLRVRGPRSAAAVVERIRSHKAEIVRTLSPQSQPGWREPFKVHPPPPWCGYPRHLHGWRSIYGPHVICATCHPPAVPEIVAEWLEHGSDVR